MERYESILDEIAVPYRYLKDLRYLICMEIDGQVKDLRIYFLEEMLIIEGLCQTYFDKRQVTRIVTVHYPKLMLLNLLNVSLHLERRIGNRRSGNWGRLALGRLRSAFEL